MKPALKTLAFLVPLLAAAPATAFAQGQTQGQRPEGNLGSGAAMGGAQSQSSGASPGSAVPAPPTHSPQPGGAASDNPARQRPEGNLGSGAAMSGAQSQSMGGGSPSTGGTSVPQPSTTSPRR